MIRPIENLLAGAKLSNIINRLFLFQALHRGRDLIELLNQIDETIEQATRRIES